MFDIQLQYSEVISAVQHGISAIKLQVFIAIDCVREESMF